MDLLPVFEMLAGKCVLCNTDATAGNATDYDHTSSEYFLLWLVREDFEELEVAL